MASIKDVAEKANVGRATVSRVLNNSGYVAEETRKKVLQAMEELNYAPNELARNLYHNKSGIVAILVPSISHPFFGEFVDYCEAELHRRGYKAMICNTSRSEDEEQEYLDMLKRSVVDGIITGAYSLDVDAYSRIDRPIVALDRYINEDIPVVAVDHIVGGRMAAQELIDCGCRSILHIRGSFKVESPSHDRHKEFNRIMAEQGITVHTCEFEWDSFDIAYLRKVIADILDTGIEIDGVFGVDIAAMECMNECVSRGMNIPEDVKVVAYDGTYVLEMSEMKITSIVQPIDRLATEAVRLVANMIDGKTYIDRQTLMDVSLVRGKTTQ